MFVTSLNQKSQRLTINSTTVDDRSNMTVSNKVEKRAHSRFNEHGSNQNNALFLTSPVKKYLILYLQHNAKNILSLDIRKNEAQLYL